MNNIPDFPQIVDSTIRAAFANCFRKGYWEFIRRKRKPGGNIHLLFGGCFAKAMEAARKAYYIRGLSQDDAITEGILAATEMWEAGEGDNLVPQGRSSGANKTFAALVDSVDSYFTRWSMEDDSIVPLRLPNGELFIEKTFAFPVDGTRHPVTGNPIIYGGRLDMLGEWKDTDLYVGIDEKSSSSLGSSWALNWNLRSQISGYCLTDDHEVLTNSGWTSISKITTQDLVAQWENGRFTFVNPIEVFCPHYEGELYLFEGKVSLSATRGHRQLVFDKRANKYKDYYVEKIPGNGHLYFVTTGEADFGEWHPPKEWLKLLVAVQADGHFTTDGAITFSFTKPRKIERLVELLDNLNIKYTIKDSNLNDIYTIRILSFNKEVKEFSNLLRSGDLTKKRWGKWLLELDNESMQTIINETVFWDGHKGEERQGWTYSTSVKSNAEWISTLACLTGFTSSISKVNFDNWAIKSENWNDAYKVHISPRRMNMVHKTNKSVSEYNGPVYCISVPSGYFLTRRNGRHIVTGNCHGSSVYGYKIRHFHIRGIGIMKEDITFAENLQTRADWQIDSWLVQVRRDINRATAAWIEMYREQEANGFDGRGMEKHWDQNLDSVCSSYGGCPFMDLCTSENPDRWLRGNYIDVDWEPLRERE